MTNASGQSDVPESPSSRPRLFSIDPTRPFLTVLVDALVTGRLVPDFAIENDPLALSTATILLPTRRAARSLRDVFLQRFGGRATLLPRIRPIGDVDEDGFETVSDSASALDAALTATERTLAMTKLVLGWRNTIAVRLLNPTTGRPPSLPTSPADAVHLATSLLDLMDQMTSSGADWADVARLVPEDHAAHWDLTLAFLKIVVEQWPAFLKTSGREDPASRRDRLVRAEAERMLRNPPDGPVIAAGSTGSIPSTAYLLGAIARLPNGAVVLPGLDRHLDDESWAAIGTDDDPAFPPNPGHPQYGLKLLLKRLRATRDMVEPLEPEADPALSARLRLLSEAMRPSETTDRWRRIAETADGAARGDAFAGMMLISARSEPEEALAIALALRETIETPGKTAALVTPDRALARRVAAELARWGLAIDDSAGVALSLTPPAVFARLVAETALKGFDPVTLVALMQHPLSAFGLARADARRYARILEIGALRGPAPRAGSEGLIAAIVQAEDEVADKRIQSNLSRRRIGTADWARAHDLAARIAACLKPLEALADRRGPVDLTDILELHIAAIETAAAIPGDDMGGEHGVFSGEAGKALALRLADLLAACRSRNLTLSLAPHEYPGFLGAILGDAPVRRRGGLEARLHIWGPLEARLQSVDRLVLGGLNEGSWPNTTRNDPWLSRTMRSDMRLEQPERRIGLAAHDVAQGAAHPDVILVRAQKSGTSPTVASRWLQRLTTVAGDEVTKAMTVRGDRYLALARRLDHAHIGPPRPVPRPKPTPPVASRPTQLSVTAIETWIRDPYALYARTILHLEPLEPIGASPDARDRGTLIHGALADFVATWDGVASPAARAHLTKLAEERLAEFAAFPEVVALWRPRMARIIDWFLRVEAERSAEVTARKPEVVGRLEIPVMGETFTLTARADRIDGLGDGSLAVLDYKTGAPPSKRQVASLLSPQLPLEAAMLLRHGFGAELAGRTISALTYYRLSGTGDGGAVASVATDPPGKTDDLSPADLADGAYARLVQLVGAYRNETKSYPSRPRIMFEALTDGDYDHLARVKEWSSGEGDDE
jgi:ATP-dependent helicase/nuclease subunit B